MLSIINKFQAALETVRYEELQLELSAALKSSDSLNRANTALNNNASGKTSSALWTASYHSSTDQKVKGL